MLVLSRNRHQNIVIGDHIVITVVDIRAGQVRLGITAPKEVPVHRQETFDTIRQALEPTEPTIVPPDKKSRQRHGTM